MSQDFDFTQYLTKEQITSIAEKVCEKQMTEYVNQILKNRTDGHQGGIVDQILHATAKVYVDKFSPEFEEAFIKRCREEIWRNTPVTGDEQCFRQGLAWELQKAAQKYIERNSDIIEMEMKDTIHQEAKLVAADKMAYLIGRKIDVQAIIRQILVEELTSQK